VGPLFKINCVLEKADILNARLYTRSDGTTISSTWRDIDVHARDKQDALFYVETSLYQTGSHSENVRFIT
jgi:hypothetical protein